MPTVRGAPRVEGGEHARLAVRRHLGDALESRVAGELHHQLAALGHAAVLRGDRGLLHPFLQALHAFGVALLDLRLDGVARPVRGGENGAREGERGHGRGRRAEEITSRVCGHGPESSPGFRVGVDRGCNVSIPKTGYQPAQSTGGAHGARQEPPRDHSYAPPALAALPTAARLRVALRPRPHGRARGVPRPPLATRERDRHGHRPLPDPREGLVRDASSGRRAPQKARRDHRAEDAGQHGRAARGPGRPSSSSCASGRSRGTSGRRPCPRSLYLPDGRVVPTCVLLAPPDQEPPPPVPGPSQVSALLGGGYSCLREHQHAFNVGTLAAS
jgi:hypothetical protein